MRARSGVTQTADRLVSAGLAERVGGHDDRRVIWAGINDAGRSVVSSSRPVFDAEAERRLGHRLTAAQLAALTDGLQAILR